MGRDETPDVDRSGKSFPERLAEVRQEQRHIRNALEALKNVPTQIALVDSRLGGVEKKVDALALSVVGNGTSKGLSSRVQTVEQSTAAYEKSLARQRALWIVVIGAVLTAVPALALGLIKMFTGG